MHSPAQHLENPNDRILPHYVVFAAVLDGRNLEHKRMHQHSGKDAVCRFGRFWCRDCRKGFLGMTDTEAKARLARLIHSEGDAGRHALQDDGGLMARQALAGAKPC